MKSTLIFFALAWTLGMQGAVYATEPPHKEGVPDVVGGLESTEKSRARLAAQRKAVSKIKTVDINSANLQQLKKLPGIGDAEAQRIIAGRPYASKIWLVTNGVIGEGPYAQIKHLIIAKQAFKTAEENAAFYEKLQKEKAAKAKP